MATEWETTEEPAIAESGAREIHFAQYWAVIVKRWRLIALCVLLCLGTAAILSLLANPAFQAAAVLEVSGAGASPLEANAMGQRGRGIDPEFLPTQMRLMKSRQIAERVVRRLNLAEKSACPPNPDAEPRSGDSSRSFDSGRSRCEVDSRDQPRRAELRVLFRAESGRAGKRICRGIHRIDGRLAARARRRDLGVPEHADRALEERTCPEGAGGADLPAPERPRHDGREDECHHDEPRRLERRLCRGGPRAGRQGGALHGLEERKTRRDRRFSGRQLPAATSCRAGASRTRLRGKARPFQARVAGDGSAQRADREKPAADRFAGRPVGVEGARCRRRPTTRRRSGAKRA